jgi:hypothetical protein
MELAKSFLMTSEKQGAVADDCKVVVYDATHDREALMFWWSDWDWEAALSRLQAVVLDFAPFNTGRWPKHNHRYGASGIFSFPVWEGQTNWRDRFCMRLWHEAKLAVREKGIDAVLMEMMKQGAPRPWAGLISENGRPRNMESPA